VIYNKENYILKKSDIPNDVKFLIKESDTVQEIIESSLSKFYKEGDNKLNKNLQQ